MSCIKGLLHQSESFLGKCCSRSVQTLSPVAAHERTQQVKYEDGDEEESSLEELERVVQHAPVGSVRSSQPSTKQVADRLLEAHARAHRDWFIPFGLPFKDFENMGGTSTSDEEDAEDDEDSQLQVGPQ